MNKNLKIELDELNFNNKYSLNQSGVFVSIELSRLGTKSTKIT